jgi:hypothetical protein
MPVSDPGLTREKAHDVIAGKKVSLEADSMPKGDAQREAWMKEMETLNARANELATKLGLERTTKPKIDREVAQVFAHEGDIPLEGLDHEHFKYSLVWRDPYNRLGGRIVFSYKRDGWEVCTSGTPEYAANREYQGADGTLHVVDCLLMRMPLAAYEAMKTKELRRRIAREEGVPVDLLELANRVGVDCKWGADALNMNPAATERMARAYERVNYDPRRSAAMDIAQRRLDAAIRAGTVPGAEIRR